MVLGRVICFLLLACALAALTPGLCLVHLTAPFLEGGQREAMEGEGLNGSRMTKEVKGVKFMV